METKMKIIKYFQQNLGKRIKILLPKIFLDTFWSLPSPPLRKESYVTHFSENIKVFSKKHFTNSVANNVEKHVGHNIALVWMWPNVHG